MAASAARIASAAAPFIPLITQGINAGIGAAMRRRAPRRFTAANRNAQRRLRSANPRSLVRKGRRVRGTSIPLAASRITRSSGSSQVVTRTEVLGSISAPSSDFIVSAYNINPGTSRLFPWLSNVATNYEQYNLKRIVVRYRPRAAATTSGQVILACSPDNTRASPRSTVEMLTLAGTVTAAAYAPLVGDFASNRFNRPGSTKFVKTGQAPDSASINDFDAGKIFVGLEGISTTDVIGQLEVQYTVELLNPANSMDTSKSAIAGATAGLSAADLVGSDFAIESGRLDVVESDTAASLDIYHFGWLLIRILVGGVNVQGATITTGHADEVSIGASAGTTALEWAAFAVPCTGLSTITPACTATSVAVVGYTMSPFHDPTL